MRRLHTWHVVLGLILAGSSAIAARAAGHSPKGELVFTVYVHNYAQVDAKTLSNAEIVATGIFRNAGVEAHWADAQEVSNGSPADLTETESNVLSNLRVYILPQEMAQRLGMPDNVMGLAPGKGPNRLLVYVFDQWLKALAERQVDEQMRGTIPWHATVAQILGAMMAHELGHILLNLPSHSESGIMKGDWDLKAMCDAAFGLLLFTRQQAEVIRAEVTRRNSDHASVVQNVESTSVAFEL